MASRYDHFHTHRRSRRLAGHNYARPGWTFVTICTAGREPFFGEVRTGVMGLGEAGCIAHACWAAIPDHVAHVQLDAFIVMPNHVHGLIGVLPGVASLHATTLPVGDAESWMASSPRAGSVSAIVRSYKSAVTKTVRGVMPEFRWQPRFHDHVVRNELALNHIRAYIQNNPVSWAEDRLHPATLR